MANFVFNIAKGRAVELYNRVKSNDPSTSAFVIVLLAASGLESDATLMDYDSLAAILAAANDELTNVGYARVVLTDTELAALPAPDDANNRYDIDIPDPSWPSIAASPGGSGKLLVCYDANTGSGSDSDILPVSAHDFVVTFDGNTVDGNVNIAGFLRAA